MGKNNSHLDNSPQIPANQNNQMSEDPKDGNRTSFTLGRDGTTPVEELPDHDKQDQDAIEAYGQRGTNQPDKNSDV